MTLALSTEKGGSAVEISGLPILPGDGVSGVRLEEAAEVLLQLQDDEGKPLTGAALKSAAEALVKDVPGVEVVNVSEAKAAKFAEDRGAFPDRPPAAEVAQEAYDRIHGPLEESGDTEGEPASSTETQEG